MEISRALQLYLLLSLQMHGGVLARSFRVRSGSPGGDGSGILPPHASKTQQSPDGIPSTLPDAPAD